MSDRRPALLRLLADGEFHAGEALGAALGCTRAAIWKQVAALRAMGLPVEAGRQQGYRLPGGATLLDATRIHASLPAAVQTAAPALAVAFELDSTSAALLAAPMPRPGEMAVCLAEYQRGGRGRRGRPWISPAARGLCLSVGWRFERGGRDLPALSIATGLWVRRALVASGYPGVCLKWPNDLILADGKLGGILVDVSGESGGPFHVVIGVGINVQAAPPADSPGLRGGLAPAALAPGGHAAPDRNALASGLIAALHTGLLRFESEGFGPLAPAWAEADWLAGRRVRVTGSGNDFEGTSRGIATDGSLLVAVGGEVRPVVAGEVSLRPWP